MNFNKFSENYKNIIISLKFTKDKLKAEQEKNSQLYDQNTKLSIRAASAFTELTPRPNFNDLYNILQEKGYY